MPNLAAEYSGVHTQASAWQWCSIIFSTFRQTAEDISLSSDSHSGVLHFPLSAFIYMVPNTGKNIKLNLGKKKKEDDKTITVNVTNFLCIC